MIKEAYGLYIANLECSLVSDPKQFWNFVKCRKGSGTVTENYFVWNDKRLRDGLSIAGAFAEYFGSVYDKPDQLNWKEILSSPVMPGVQPLIISNITADQVAAAVKLEGGTFIARYARSATFNYFEYNC